MTNKKAAVSGGLSGLWGNQAPLPGLHPCPSEGTPLDGARMEQLRAGRMAVLHFQSARGKFSEWKQDLPSPRLRQGGHCVDKKSHPKK